MGRVTKPLNPAARRNYSRPVKQTLLLATCLILTSCYQPDENKQAGAGQAPATPGAASSNRQTGTRWAIAHKQRIESVIEDWSERQIKEALRAEVLTVKETEQLEQYEILSLEFAKLYSAQAGLIDPATGMPVWTNRLSQQEYQAFSTRVDQARVPIAAILDRREQRAHQFRHRYTSEQLIAEYVGDRFDLVVDPRNEYASNDSTILYQTAGETTDITGGVIKLFQQKTNP